MRYLFAATAIFFAPPADAADLPNFKTQEIDTGLKTGCAVIVVDIDGDKKPDVVAVERHKVVWYRNPGKRDGGWKKFTILDGKTRPDNVCVAAIDVDGDGRPELVVGAAWKPFDTTNAAQLVWLKRGKSVFEEWTMHELPCDEPMVRRIGAVDVDGGGKPSVVVVPAVGRGATEKGNWADGRPVRIVAITAPAKTPEKKENWKTRVLSEELSVVHNFDVCYQAYTDPTKVASILTAGPAGTHALWMRNGEVTKHNPMPFRDPIRPDRPPHTREVRDGHLSEPKLGQGNVSFTATIESWHRSQVAVYVHQLGSVRTLLDENLGWGSAIRCADLDGDKGDEIILGVRDDPNPKAGDRFKARRGVRVYKCTDGKGERWEGRVIDDGGVAVEDLAAADLDGDGKIDIIAIGGQTGNVRIYWNQGK